jgi:hypothetical protein
VIAAPPLLVGAVQPIVIEFDVDADTVGVPGAPGAVEARAAGENVTTDVAAIKIATKDCSAFLTTRTVRSAIENAFHL